ncbi:MAG: hypothetical protein CL670_08345 [Balneola sp.]|nr:hypothetical protein [Balneola sp.]
MIIGISCFFILLVVTRAHSGRFDNIIGGFSFFLTKNYNLLRKSSSPTKNSTLSDHLFHKKSSVRYHTLLFVNK